MASISTRLRVYLADDHEVVRTGLRTLINAQPDMQVVGEAGNGLTAFQEILDLRPDIAIMDVSMPNVNGARATERLRSEWPEVRVVALTVHENRGYLRELLNAGARGYVLKQSSADELILAVRAVAAGRLYVDSSLAERVVRPPILQSGPHNGALQIELSDRETDVVRLIAQGYSLREIASQLALSMKTVETYRARAVEKLGLRTRADFFRYSVHRGWLRES